MRKSLLLLATLVPTMVPTLAQTALPPCVQDDNVRAATAVIQVAVKGVTRSPDVSVPDRRAFCTVDATIHRVFRGGGSVGDPIIFQVLCSGNGMPGPDVIYSPKALETTDKLEVHLSDGAAVTDGPSVHFLTAFTDQIVWQPYCK